MWLLSVCPCRNNDLAGCLLDSTFSQQNHVRWSQHRISPLDTISRWRDGRREEREPSAQARELQPEGRGQRLTDQLRKEHSTEMTWGTDDREDHISVRPRERATHLDDKSEGSNLPYRSSHGVNTEENYWPFNKIHAVITTEPKANLFVQNGQ